ncbi:MAG: FapA family protein, partial [Desulfobacterales bacterium]|nr:FapA family protein [Desulfobacterales bacterium]
QESVLMETFAEKRRTFPGYTVSDLFRDTDVLSEEGQTFLFAVRDHLEMKMLDKKFGELGVANRLIDPDSVQRALDIQSTIFKETSKSKLIGDILLENQEITRADKAAILLTQDRIKDELLSETLNDIAATEIERLNMNMRFGAIAVKKGFVNIDQLNQALRQQKTEVDQGKERRYLGLILKEMYNLPEEVLNRILKIQRILEKNRLSLEKALEQYNSETQINKRLASLFTYRFSRSKLEAALSRSKHGFEHISVRDLKRWLTTVGISYGLCPDEEIDAFLKARDIGDEIIIARGAPPERGRDSWLEFFFDAEFQPAEENQDPNVLPMVKKGDALARIVPAQPGIPGKDVSGFSIPAPVPKSVILNCGEGVIREEDLYLAEHDGIALLYKGRTLFVKPRKITIPVRHHTGSVDTDLGETYEGAHLKLEGSVLKNGRIRCHKLEVSGDILGQVSAADDIIVKGNIGPGHADESAEPAKLKAEGEILAGKTISNAILITGKNLKAPGADLSATAVQAYQDITVKNVLNQGPRPCILQTGKVPNLKAEGMDILIQTRQDELNRLMCSDEAAELGEWLRQKLEIKDVYLQQQTFLKYVVNLCRCKPLASLTSLSDKLLAAKKNPGKWPELGEMPDDSGQVLADFKKEFIEETRDMDTAALESHAGEQADIKYGMYRAAVSATRRYHREYEEKQRQLEERIKANAPEIKKMEELIKKLEIRKDTFLLGQIHESQPVPPAIRVKNQVARGTVIKGKQTRLTVDQNMFGVKFTEQPPSAGEPPEILIEGFYD